jgi:plastocyanin
MNKLSIIKGLLPTVLILGWMVGGCSQKPQHIPQRVEVVIQQMQFTPSEIDVHAGDTIVFINKGIVVHDVTEEIEKAWTSGPIQAGESFELIAEKDVNYYCSIHPIMTGKITISRQ